MALVLALEQTTRARRLLGKEFSSFGGSRISLPNRRLRSLQLERQLTEARKQVHEHVAKVPGVYGMVDSGGELIYVGYSAKLKSRLLKYFSEADPERKEARIAMRAVRLVWEEIGHDLAARLREIELIRRFHPLMNRQGKSVRDASAYLCFEGDATRRVCLVEEMPAEGSLSWGPVMTSRRMNEAVHELNLTFGLADCSRETPISLDQECARGGCLRSETGSCVGPCQGERQREQYATQLQQAQGFLDGQETHVLAKLEADMRRCQTKLEFHSAARLRDRWLALEYLHRELEELRDPIKHEFVYAPRVGRKCYWFVIRHSLVHWVGCQPTRPQQAKAVLQVLGQEQLSDTTYGVRSDRTLERIVNGWFREFPTEREQTMTLAAARRHCESLLAEQAASH